MDKAGVIVVAGRGRVLFVDDDPFILRMLSRVLSPDRHRWEMIFALGGEAGLVELRASAFDLVVTDFQMPTINGVDLLAIAKRESPQTARMMLTGSGVDATTIDASIVLEKPPSLNDLRAAIERLLAR